jgi:hypothetical protein
MKTMKLSKQIFLLYVFIFGMSCSMNLFGITAKGNVITREKEVAGFNSIELLSSANVEITKGEKFGVIVSDYENIIDYIAVSVENNQLVITTEPSVKINRSKAKVTITMPDNLHSVSLKGSGDVDVKSNFTSLNSISVSGSGNVRAESCCGLDNLDVFVYGSGNVDLKGNVQHLKAIISGTGNMNLFDLQAQSAECFMIGSGDIKVNALKELNVTNSGAGNIIYKGDPLVAMDVNGVGSVKRF